MTQPGERPATNSDNGCEECGWGLGVCDCGFGSGPREDFRRPLSGRQRIARAAAGGAFLGLLPGARRLPASLGWPVGAAAAWFGASHLAAAAMSYRGCPEVGALPSLVLGRPVETRCGPWRKVDRVLGLERGSSKVIGPDRLARWLERGGPRLVDVLPEEHFEKVHLPGAINLPLGDLRTRAPQELHTGEPLVVYCSDAACPESEQAAAELEALGFDDVYSLDGGIAEWRRRGHEVERPAPEVVA